VVEEYEDHRLTNILSGPNLAETPHSSIPLSFLHYILCEDISFPDFTVFDYKVSLCERLLGMSMGGN
jgi:hypothetical protein